MSDHSILLIIGGGIAACKSLELIRLLRREKTEVRCILTKAGEKFVTPLSAATLSGHKAHTDLFDATEEADINHIALSRRAGLIVVCPATADLIAKAAQGLAPDLATTLLLATDAPVLMVPAMNVRMWQHPATRRNIETLRADGIHFMEPDCGEMACGEFGPGRLPEPDSISADILSLLEGHHGAPDAASQAPAPPVKTLSGKTAIVTAGPTRERLDPVRFLSNESSGRQGFALASALQAEGADVLLICGPTALRPPAGLKTRPIETACQMLEAVEAALPADIFVGVAAVSDWRPEHRSEQKLKLKGEKPTHSLSLIENPDILHRVATRKTGRPALVAGFAAETETLETHARAKLLAKGCDWMIANDVSGEAVGSHYNQIQLLTRRGDCETWPRMHKSALAQKLARRMGEALKDNSSAACSDLRAWKRRIP